MPTTVPDVGTGFTIAFASYEDWTPQIIEVKPPGTSVESLRTSHQGTATAHTYIPSDLKENDTLEFNIYDDPDNTPPVGVSDTVTLVFPSSTWWRFTGFIESYTPEEVFEDTIRARIVVKVSGAITTAILGPTPTPTPTPTATP